MDIPHPLGIFGRVGEGVTTSNSHTTKEVRPSPPPIPLPCAGGGLGAKPSSRDAPPLPARWAIGFMLLGCGWGAEGSQVPVPPPEGAPGSRGLWVGRGGVARLRARRAAGRQAIFFFFFFYYARAVRPAAKRGLLIYLFCFVCSTLIYAWRKYTYTYLRVYLYITVCVAGGVAKLRARRAAGRQPELTTLNRAVGASGSQ